MRLTKTVGDTTHEYFYSGEVLDMEVVKVKDTVTEYRSYEWNGYTPLGMMVKAKNESGTFETKAYQFITNHRGDVLIKEHRLSSARPVRTSMDLTSCEAVIVKIKKSVHTHMMLMEMY
ncbi:hypothetical protein [Kurthia sibirica]|uniref:Uncharacterized protein n=1 Tax=Kurthia sibirica TaxID=202750 RepID=A0A2U3AIS6_9BACL|nr:hypothetical protein [Kurthia sibirica]PWI24462.1 hypothetical protein DEX24_13440 [Kurthia sibirica]